MKKIEIRVFSPLLHRLMIHEIGEHNHGSQPIHRLRTMQNLAGNAFAPDENSKVVACANICKTRYSKLLDAAAHQGGAFSLAWRDDLSHDDTASELVTTWRRDLVHETHVSNWPCMLGGGNSATVRFYRFSDKTLDALRTADEVFAWHPPRFPQDLCFYNESGECWFFSDPHDEEVFVDLGKISRATLNMLDLPVTTPPWKSQGFYLENSMLSQIVTLAQ